MRDSVRIDPVNDVRGEITAPGDKSISHRAAIFAAVARGRSRLRGYLAGEDCLNTLGALGAMGADFSIDSDGVTLNGVDGDFVAPAGTLDMGNSGTGMRLLAGLLAGQPFCAEMTGDASLLSRPMGRIREPLELMGAKVDLLGDGLRGPVRVTGGGLKGIEYVLPVASAQVKSCVLIAGLFARGRTVVVEKRPTRDHTEKMLIEMGARICVDGMRITVDGPLEKGELSGRDRIVPGDFSSAAFWLALAACRQGASLTVRGVGLNSRRTAFLDVLRRMGADVEIAGADPGGYFESAGDITVRGAGLRGTEVMGDEIPNLIDELPLVAVLGAFAEGVTVIGEAGELRVKESDRIAVMAANLAKAGACVEERPDGMVITGSGGQIDGGVTLDSHGDHRVAMCMVVCGLLARRPVEVTGTECVATSYPGFWSDMGKVTGFNVE